MQSQFEYNVYKNQCYFSLLLVFVMYSIRTPTTIDFLNVFDFLKAVFNGCWITITERFVVICILCNVELDILDSVFMLWFTVRSHVFLSCVV